MHEIYKRLKDLWDRGIINDERFWSNKTKLDIANALRTEVMGDVESGEEYHGRLNEWESQFDNRPVPGPLKTSRKRLSEIGRASWRETV